jgi:hypothetical protein
MILETFFLMEEKRLIRTLFFQNLCREQVYCPLCNDMTAKRRPQAKRHWPMTGQTFSTIDFQAVFRRLSEGGTHFLSVTVPQTRTFTTGGWSQPIESRRNGRN